MSDRQPELNQGPSRAPSSIWASFSHLAEAVLQARPAQAPPPAQQDRREAGGHEPKRREPGPSDRVTGGSGGGWASPP